MFIYSIRASTVRYFAVIALSIVLLIAILLVGGTADASYTPAGAKEITFSGIKTNEDRVAFIKQFGIEVSDVACEHAEFIMPENFDRVILGYNELQKSQGLELSKYKNKRVNRYTYEVKNYEGYDGTVYVNLIIYRSTVIGCDISSAERDGFVKPLITFR